MTVFTPKSPVSDGPMKSVKNHTQKLIEIGSETNLCVAAAENYSPENE